jgi:carotenoid 9,10(9',10')-cleavage dioxygenase 1
LKLWGFLICHFVENIKQRYVYCTILDSIVKVTGIIKFDLHVEPESGRKELEVGGNVQGIYDLGPDIFGSEAIFVPKHPGVSGEEDDDYLIFFVHDENTGYSFSWLGIPLSCTYCHS